MLVDILDNFRVSFDRHDSFALALPLRHVVVQFFFAKPTRMQRPQTTLVKEAIGPDTQTRKSLRQKQRRRINVGTSGEIREETTAHAGFRTDAR